MKETNAKCTIFDLNAMQKSERLDLAMHVAGELANGKIFILPTDTIHGISCVYDNVKARERLAKIKRSDIDKNLIALCGNAEEVKKRASQQLSDNVLQLWPSPLTIVFQAILDAKIQQSSLAARVPDYSWLLFMLKILQQPIASSSANLSGHAYCTNSLVSLFQSKVDGIVLDLSQKSVKPSTILDVSGQCPKILRQGAFSIPTSILTKHLIISNPK